MQGSVSQPDLCLYVSAVQAFKAHQPPTQPAAPSQAAPTAPPAPPSVGHPALLPRWLAWLLPNPSR